MTAILVSVDPGPGTSAIVVVAPAARGKVALLKAATVDSTCEALAEAWRLIVASFGRPAVVALESALDGFAYSPCRVPHLLGQERAVGRLEALAWRSGVPTMLVKASTWRAAVVGRVPTTTTLAKGKDGKLRKKRVAVEDTDALVARALPTWVEGLERSNVHVRDALGLSVFASREVWRRRVA